jgi:hypothetical protein
LRQRVFKSEIRDGAVGGSQEDAERGEQKRAPQSVAEHLAEGSALGHAAGDGIRKRDADQEGE